MSALLGEDRLVLAFRVRQKESAFYLVNYRAQDLVRRVRLTARAPRRGSHLRVFGPRARGLGRRSRRPFR